MGDGAKRVRTSYRCGGGMRTGGAGALADAFTEGVADGGGAGGGGGACGTGRVAHQMPAARKSAMPSTGSHIGVFGSSPCAGWLSMWLFGVYEDASTVKVSYVRTSYARRVKPKVRMALALVGIGVGIGLVTPIATGDTHTTLPVPHPSSTVQAGDAGAASGLSADRIRQSIVTVEVPGRGVTGVAIVLEADGRMLTSLAAVGPNDAADVRYADGHTVHTRAAHKDAVLDLALLVPLSGRFTTGLLASELDPALVELRTLSLATGRPTLTSTKFKGRVDAHAKDGTALSGATELDGHAPSGAPVLDPAGRVLGLVAHACRGADAGACADVSVVVPILSIRIFLSRTPSNAVPPSPWLGINGTPDVVSGIRGVRVQAVAPHSPAERGGLHNQTDLIVVADGQPIDTPERLAEIVSKHAVGDVVKLSVFAAGHYRDASVTLQAPP